MNIFMYEIFFLIFNVWWMREKKLIKHITQIYSAFSKLLGSGFLLFCTWSKFCIPEFAGTREWAYTKLDFYI